MEDDGEAEFEMPKARRPSGGDALFGKTFEGVIPNLRRRYEEGSWAVQEDLEVSACCASAPAATAIG